MIEFALLERVPDSVDEGLRQITEDNRQEHKLFLASVGRKDGNEDHEERSGISNRYSYRTVVNDEDLYSSRHRNDSEHY